MASIKIGKQKLRREEIPKDSVLCEHCTAKCCRYFALPIETPESREDWDFVRWYLVHQGASVFTEDESWYLLVHTVCKHLGDDHLCGIYETRPEICRSYTTESCEYEDDWTYEKYLETPEQVSEYCEAILQKKGADLRSPKPALLPILA